MRMLCAVLLLAVAHPAYAQGSEARRAFEAGRSAYAQGDMERAARELARSLELAPRAGTAYNLANAEAARGRPAAAANLADALLAGEYGELSAAQREEAGALLASLASSCARVLIALRGPEGTVVELDGRPVAPDEPVYVSVGEHRARAQFEGLRARSQTFRVAGGERRTVRLDLIAGSARIELVGEGELEIVGVARGIGRVESALDPGDYRVRVVGQPSQQVHVVAGERRRIDFGEGSASRRPRRVAIALAAVAVVGAAIAIGFAVRDTGVRPDPVFGVVEALQVRR